MTNIPITIFTITEVTNFTSLMLLLILNCYSNHYLLLFHYYIILLPINSDIGNITIIISLFPFIKHSQSLPTPLIPKPGFSSLGLLHPHPVVRDGDGTQAPSPQEAKTNSSTFKPFGQLGHSSWIYRMILKKLDRWQGGVVPGGGVHYNPLNSPALCSLALLKIPFTLQHWLMVSPILSIPNGITLKLPKPQEKEFEPRLPPGRSQLLC